MKDYKKGILFTFGYSLLAVLFSLMNTPAAYVTWFITGVFTAWCFHQWVNDRKASVHSKEDK